MNKVEPENADRNIGAGRHRYVTTAIPYVNAEPHVGFALEVIQADCLARLYRTQGYNVRFQAGTDDNSLKNVQAAQAKGMAVKELVRTNARRFYGLKDALNLSYDDFIQTSSDERHRVGVEKLWAACLARGDIYRRAYDGLYCTGCEQFYKSKELDNGRCPEHQTVPDEVSEENYFFRLSRYEDRLSSAILSGDLEIVPASRRNEVLSSINQGLEDFSISRSATRARGWGIPVPGDPDQVIYVWFDALANYITALVYGRDGAGLAAFWRDAATREHVIGKGISRFHAIYWPAILLSAGLILPSRVFVHGYITVNGQKIGKSNGNAIDPVPLAEHLGADALRYYLLRHIRSTEDGDFDHRRFCLVYDTELAGQLGNLAHRTISMIERYCLGAVRVNIIEDQEQDDLQRAVNKLPGTVQSEIERFQFHVALAAIWEAVALANKFVTHCEPWALARTASEAIDSKEAEDARYELEACLSRLVMALEVIGQCLAPLLPSTSDALLLSIGFNQQDCSYEGSNRKLPNPASLLFPKRD